VPLHTSLPIVVYSQTSLVSNYETRSRSLVWCRYYTLPRLVAVPILENKTISRLSKSSRCATLLDTLNTEFNPAKILPNDIAPHQIRHGTACFHVAVRMVCCRQRHRLVAVRWKLRRCKHVMATWCVTLIFPRIVLVSV
jgi:hypothetical protein